MKTKSLFRNQSLCIVGICFVLNFALHGAIPEKKTPKVPSAAAVKKAKPITSGPFKGIDPSKLDYTTGALILSASTDYQLALRYKNPIYAIQSGTSFNDGGTRVYIGKGYRLILLSSISQVGKLKGISTGVRLIFDDDVAPGNNKEFAETRFVRRDF